MTQPTNPITDTLLDEFEASLSTFDPCADPDCPFCRARTWMPTLIAEIRRLRAAARGISAEDRARYEAMVGVWEDERNAMIERGLHEEA